HGRVTVGAVDHANAVAMDGAVGLADPEPVARRAVGAERSPAAVVPSTMTVTATKDPPGSLDAAAVEPGIEAGECEIKSGLDLWPPDKSTRLRLRAREDRAHHRAREQDGPAGGSRREAEGGAHLDAPFRPRAKPATMAASRPHGAGVARAGSPASRGRGRRRRAGGVAGVARARVFSDLWVGCIDCMDDGPLGVEAGDDGAPGQVRVSVELHGRTSLGSARCRSQF